MSWRNGAKLFWEIWPSIKTHIPDVEHRREFTKATVELFLDNDCDRNDLYGRDPEINAAIDEVDPEIPPQET